LLVPLFSRSAATFTFRRINIKAASSGESSKHGENGAASKVSSPVFLEIPRERSFLYILRI
jgi:hypothetical protein